LSSIIGIIDHYPTLKRRAFFADQARLANREWLLNIIANILRYANNNGSASIGGSQQQPENATIGAAPQEIGRQDNTGGTQ
jgi:hypothetical protein